MNTWTKAVSLVSIKTAIGLAVLMFFLVVIGIVFYVSFAKFEGTITQSVEPTITLRWKSIE
ncbi:MAG: hypothetical protein WAM88_00080 [Nitrososphaeraceae archaeon]